MFGKRGFTRFYVDVRYLLRGSNNEVLLVLGQSMSSDAMSVFYSFETTRQTYQAERTAGGRGLRQADKNMLSGLNKIQVILNREAGACAHQDLVLNLDDAVAAIKNSGLSEKRCADLCSMARNWGRFVLDRVSGIGGPRVKPRECERRSRSAAICRG